MELYEAIKARASVREYSGSPVEKSAVTRILKAGILAPSGKNGQVWRFAVVQKNKKLLREIADCTVYKDFARTANCLICVYLDKEESYHYIKDCQAVGACIQNMLLAATEEKLGACWIGEILNRAADVRKLLKVDDRYELMAVIALGKPTFRKTPRTTRKPLKECMLLNK